MTLQQKIAWFNIAVAALAILAYFILLPIVGPWRATGGFGVLGLAGIGGFVWMFAKRNGRIVTDERDVAISRKALSFAKTCACATLLVAFLILVGIQGTKSAISVQGLSLVIWWVVCAYLMIYSIAMLVFYARE